MKKKLFHLLLSLSFSVEIIFAKEVLDPYKVHLLPQNLHWQSNNGEQNLSSPLAKRGGELNLYIKNPPSTLRLYGPNVLHDMRSILNSLQLPLVAKHPDTKQFISILAKEWAFADDQKTVFFKIDPAAVWSDGVSVTADDFIFQIEFWKSPFVLAPIFKNLATEEIVEIKKYDAKTFSMTWVKPLPKEILLDAVNIAPSPKHFHKLDADWITQFDWKVEPNTGAYQLHHFDKSSKYIFKRKSNWWGDVVPFFKNRFNIDQVNITVIRDENMVFEFFKRNKISFYSLRDSTIEQQLRSSDVYKSQKIKVIEFESKAPVSGFGLWLNKAIPLLADKDIRVAIQHSLNFEKFISNSNGEFRRVNSFYNFSKEFHNPSIIARKFDEKFVEQIMMKKKWKRNTQGIWQKGATKFSFSILYGSPIFTPMLLILKEEAKKAGLELNLKLVDGSQFTTLARNKKHEAVILNRAADDYPNFSPFNSKFAFKDNTANYTNTSDKSLDEMINQYESSINLDAKKMLAEKILMWLHDDAAFIPTLSTTSVEFAVWDYIRFPESQRLFNNSSIFSWVEVASGGYFWSGI